MALALSSLEVELKALEVRLSYARAWQIQIANIFTDCVAVAQAWNLNRSDNIWRLLNLTNNLKHIVEKMGNPKVEVIPRDWKFLADDLARKGSLSPTISLFHRGLDLPRWLMRTIEDLGLHF